MHTALDNESSFKPSKKRHDFQSIKPVFHFVSEHNFLERNLDGEKKSQDIDTLAFKTQTPETSFIAEKKAMPSPEMNGPFSITG